MVKSVLSGRDQGFPVDICSGSMAGQVPSSATMGMRDFQVPGACCMAVGGHVPWACKPLTHGERHSGRKVLVQLSLFLQVLGVTEMLGGLQRDTLGFGQGQEEDGGPVTKMGPCQATVRGACC